MVVYKILIYVYVLVSSTYATRVITNWESECDKLSASPDFLPYVPHVATCLTCLRAFMFLVLTCLHFFTCLTCLHVLTYLTCPHFLHALCAFIFYWPYRPSCFFVSSFFMRLNFIYVYAKKTHKLAHLCMIVNLCHCWVQSSINVYQVFSPPENSCHILQLFFKWSFEGLEHYLKRETRSCPYSSLLRLVMGCSTFHKKVKAH